MKRHRVVVNNNICEFINEGIEHYYSQISISHKYYRFKIDSNIYGISLLRRERYGVI